jgi:hypothetical protein
MTQSELNDAIAKQTGESKTEIARRGFSLMSETADGNEPSEETDDLLLLLTATEEESFYCSNCDEQ